MDSGKGGAPWRIKIRTTLDPSALSTFLTSLDLTASPCPPPMATGVLGPIPNPHLYPVDDYITLQKTRVPSVALRARPPRVEDMSLRSDPDFMRSFPPRSLAFSLPKAELTSLFNATRFIDRVTTPPIIRVDN
jgi:hypothetical protein